MIEPVREAAAQAVDALGGPGRDQPAHSQRVDTVLPRQPGLDLRAHLRDLLHDRGHRAGGLLRVDIFHPHSRFVERDDFRREREHGRQLGDHRGVGVELFQIRFDR
jgi:hypothetical protein